MVCVLRAEGLEKQAPCWRGVGKFGTREWEAGGWGHLVIWWEGENS